MTAIFTGLGSGLAKSSATALGSAGTLGNAATGRAGEGLSVNAATGNLLISRRDEFLTGRSLDVGISRTYNSLADVHDGDNGDGWQQSTSRRVFGQTGTLNGAGSTISRVSGDGSVVTYTYGTRSGVASYWSTDGSGSHDRMWHSGGDWYWQDGSSRITERYDADPYNAGEFRIIRQTDKDNQSLVFGYSGSKLSYVQTNNSEFVRYTWSGDKLTSIKSEFKDPKTGATVTETGTYYAYDGNGRLATVTIDMTPELSGTSDGDKYTISYLYDSAGRVTRMTQSDGSRTDIAYDAQGRVTQLDEHVGAGEIRTTRIGYGRNVTSVTDAQGQVTKLWYDAKGQMIQLMSPPATRGGKAIVQQFEYDNDGNLLRTIQTDAENASVAGNLVEAGSWGDGEQALRGDNLVDDSGWPQDRDGALPAAGTVGQGWTSSYIGETEWTKTTGPYGQSVVSLRSGQTNTSSAGGGALSESFAVDKSQAYEFTIYMKADQLDKHRAYFGLSGGIVKDGHNGAVNNNPYFTYEYPSASKGWSANKWVKIVGYVLPDGTSSEPHGSVGGVYDLETGDKLYGMRHFTWNGASAADSTYMRFFNFYNTERQGKFTHWVRPEVRQITDTAILRGSEKLDIARDARLFGAPTAEGWYNVGWANNDDEARWSAVDGPDGAREIALETGQFDTSANGGGQYTNQFTIDPGKAYKFTQYFRKDDLTKHNIYFGLSSHGSAYVKTHSSGAANTNPYFMALAPSTQQSIGMEAGKWYKVVSYVLPEGTPNSSTYHGGIYDAETGTKIHGVTNYRWSETRPNNSVHARFFTYYNQTDHGWTTDWMDPEVVALDASQVVADAADPFGVVYDESGTITRYTYDARGNVTKVDRPIGTDVTKWYDANNNLIKELSYSANEASANTGSYVRYAYDSENHLRYKVTAEGHVTEYRYDSYGRMTWQGDYTKYTFAHASANISETGMNAWRDGLVDKTQVDWLRYAYDARGNVAWTLNYGAATATGGAASSGSLEGYSRTYYAYDQEGRLLTRYGQSESGKEQFVYDGMGRLVSSSDSAGATTSVFFDDANSRTVMQMASGLTRTMVYNKAGDLVSSTDSSVGPNGGNLAGALTSWGVARANRTAAPAISGKAAFKYTVPVAGSYGATSRGYSFAAGETVKYRITLMGSGSQTMHRLGIYGNTDGWGTNKDTKTQATIINGPGKLTQSVGGLWQVDGISTTAATTVEITRTFDTAQSGGSYFYVGGTGQVAANTAVILSDPTVIKTTTDAAHDFSATTNNQYDKLGRLRVTQDAFDGRGPSYFIYDKAGRKVGSVDPAGRLVEHFYDSNSRLTGSTTYYNAVSAEIRAQLADPENRLEMSDIRPALHGTYDVREFTTYDANGRAVQTINGEGEVVSFKYDGSGRLIETRNHFNKVSIASAWLTNPPASPVSLSNNSKDAVTRTFYDRDGNVRGVLDGEGYLSEFVYDQSGQQTVAYSYAQKTSSSYWASGTFNQLRGTANVSSSANRYVRSVYNGRGELRFQIDSSNYVTQFKYNYAGKLTTTTQHITPLAGNHSNWTIAGVKAALGTSGNDRAATNYYDFAGRLWRTVDPVGLDTRMYFDAAGNVIKTTAGNRTARNWYDARGNVRFSLDPEGYLSSYLYNEGGQVTHERRYDSKKTASDTTTFAQAAALATGGYSEVRSTYDAQGRVNYSYDAVGNRTRYAYRTNGQLAYTNTGDNASADLSQTYFYYDNAGRLTRQDSANGQSEESITYFTYDGLGNQTRVTDGNGHTADFTYDKRGQVLTEKNGAGNLVRYEYNAFGDLTKTWDAKNVLASEHVYDKRGLVTRTYDALRNATNYTYTQYGEVKTVTDPLAAVTTFTYDKLGRVKSVKDARNFTETYNYDAYGNRTSMTNKLGGTISYVFDKLGRMTSMNDANGIVTAYTYDARGNQLTKTEASGRAEARTTTNTFDKSNRLTQTSIQGHSTSYVTQYAYDSRGNVIRQIAPDGGKTVYFYDDLDRVTAEINALGTYTGYTYDDNGNVKTVKVYATTVGVPSTGGAEESSLNPTPTGTYRETRFDYDGANRMTKSHVMGVTSRYYTGSALANYSGTTLTTQYIYDANGNVTKTIDPNGGTTWAYYDAMGRKQHQVDAQNFRTSWTYDGGGNVTREIRYANATATPTSTTTVPGLATDTSLDRRTDYTYDKMGNRLTEQRFYVKYHNNAGAHSTGHPKVTYAYNGLGQVTKKTEAITSNVTDYLYDVGGRLTRETRAAFTDFNGNSVRPTVQYYYDGLDNLTRTRQYGATGAAERNTYYYYKKGQLDRMTDAGGLTRYHRYDNAGRETEVYYTRTNYSNVSRTEGVKRTYDTLGRVVSEFQGTKSGSTWTAVSPTVTTTYNAFGEVATIKAGTGATQQNVYDKAGRLERTNAGDGVWKIFAHDRNGNQTAAITSAGYNIGNRSFSSALGLISRADVNITYTTYDKRGSALMVYETDRDISTTAINQTLTTERRYNAFGEVSYEKDALGADIYYDYTTMGKVWRVRNPSVAIQNENGSTATVRPTEYYYHDLGGRLTGSRDANGNLTRFTLLNGTGFGGSQALATAETYADGGVKTTKYDIHGDARRIISVADGRSTTYRTIEQTFDAMGRVTQTWNRGTNLQDNYTYDLAGQQLSHWNNVFGSGNREIMDYDAMGRVVSSRAFGGDTTTTTYTWEVSSNTNAVGNFGGWKEETRTLANNRTLTQWSDLFDRVKRKNDYGGNNYTYTYNAGGQMASLSGAGGNQQYVFYNTGKLKSISNVTGVLNSQNFQELKTTYGYDKVGNLTSQKTTDRGSTFYNFYWNDYEPDVYSYTWNRTTQNMTATYDKLGRMKTWNEAGGGDLPAASIAYSYDANGNIRRSNASYRHILSDQTVSTYTSTQDNWYRYDNMNRVVTSRGVLANGQIVRGTGGRDIVYNKAGQRTQVLTTSRESYRWYYDPYGGEDFFENDFNDGPGGLPPTNQPFGQGYWRTDHYNATVREDYTYDNGGQLKQVNTAKSGFNGWGWEQANEFGGINIPNIQDYVLAVPTTGSKKADYSYDAMSRITLQRDWSGSTVVYSRNVYYNAEGLVYRDDSTTRKGSDNYRANMYNYYNADNSLNNSYTYNYKNGSTSGVNHTRTTNTYAWYDGAVQSRVDFDSNTGSSSDRIYNSTYSYDSFGVLQSAQVNDGRARSVSFINNAEGQVISRKERDNKYDQGDPSEIYYRFGGKEIGRVGNNGTANVAYEKSIAQRSTVAPSTPGAFRNGASYGSSYADFGGDYDAINSFSQGSGGGTYTVRGGESLQAIAAQLWGDSALWYKIAEANGLSGREPLVEGRSLVIPTGIQRVHHNSSTLKPYDPAEAIGDTSPTTPDAPKKKSKKCGIFGQILLAVVAIAVTVVTAGTLGPVGAAIAGNLASQGLGLATGIQEKFSFKSLALSAVAAGVAQGVGEVFGKGAIFGSQVAGDAIRGAISSAVTQGVGVATGLQEKFSWAGVAAAGVGAGVGSFVGARTGSLGSFGSRAVTTAASTIANAATRSVVDGSNFGDNIMAALPDAIGQVVGGAIGDVANKAIRDAAFKSRFLDALPPSIPRKVREQIYAEYRAGKAPGVVLGGAANTLGEFNDATMTITMNGQLLAAAADNPLVGAYAAMSYLEELGHWADARAGQIMGVAGFDSAGDEGAVFAARMAGGIAGEGGSIISFSIPMADGSTVSIGADSTFMKAIAIDSVMSGRTATENRVGGVEAFHADGHYATVFAHAIGAADAMGIQGNAAMAVAQQLALGAQLPDMVARFDAFSNFKKWAREKPTFRWSDADARHLRSVYEGLHAIPTIRRSAAAVQAERDQTADVFVDYMRAGNYLAAGVSLHRFGDLYAHTLDDGSSYGGLAGHGHVDAFGTSPDLMFGARRVPTGYGPYGPTQFRTEYFKLRTGMVTQYSNALGSLISRGYRAAGLSTASVRVGQEGATSNFRRFYNAANTEIGFINSIRSEYSLPITEAQMHVGGGYRSTLGQRATMAEVMGRLD
ncbi:LysM peptidoglycan-binding domain-containing protein [Parerythrobacter jejuensis]|uniref:LysM peptidoglycan-binding domain-containing protein n=1 Tax=Parerythrobacter jejuensis TaxID=795812 RepID=A0A845AUZ0_9SPHN|nr:LysM peptidoglycan-binding domain-containing protein [Parerythrobacter jejuensis]MXP30559.1 LysM peptidoglycan-binding domain-containing protein [Parerythrobacter jejuensis]MXP33319.1 LysM peptidoglycan-binding domain-containing protein [Parerythrobacter jejuensis]